jgi:hypothetical protein
MYKDCVGVAERSGSNWSNVVAKPGDGLLFTIEETWSNKRFFDAHSRTRVAIQMPSSLELRREYSLCAIRKTKAACPVECSNIFQTMTDFECVGDSFRNPAYGATLAGHSWTEGSMVLLNISDHVVTAQLRLNILLGRKMMIEIQDELAFTIARLAAQ